MDYLEVLKEIVTEPQMPQTLKEPSTSPELMDQIIKHDSVQEANDRKRKLEDKGNIINNNYQNNYNNNNRNNDHHQQQNRKQETFRTYTATNGYTGNRPLCERCTLHHIDLFTFDIQGTRTYEEYELNNTVTRDLKEPWLDNRNHKWYDELADGKLKEETLMHKAKVEESWGIQLPVNYGADNTGYTQDYLEHKKEHHDPSTCHVRRFEMIKYSLDADDEYVAIKENKCSEHSETNFDTCQAYQELFRIMDEGWLVTKACDE
ncbi:hypothetical protein Tco_0714460 [Tanacetum coccineum]